MSKHVPVVVLLALVLSAYKAAASDSDSGSTAAAVTRILSVQNLLKHRLELAAVLFIALYIVLAVIGSKENYNIATYWLRVLGQDDSVLGCNFAVHGDVGREHELWWKDSASSFKCYATGRRYCSGALLTLDLKARQDLLSRLWYLVSPHEDVLRLEVFMNEAAMPQTVLIIGQKKRVASLLKDVPKLGQLTKPVQVAKERVPGGWPAGDKITVAAEHSSLLYELLNAEPAISKAINLPSFRLALLSSEETAAMQDENHTGPRLTFAFALPPQGQDEELNALLSSAFLLVDLLGGYKASHEMKKKSQELRQKVEQDANKQDAQDRQELLQQKRLTKLEAERAKARAAGPAALARYEEKHQARMRQKEMRKRMIRA